MTCLCHFVSAHFTNFVIIPDSVMGHNNVPLSPPLSRAVYESSKSYLWWASRNGTTNHRDLIGDGFKNENEQLSSIPFFFNRLSLSPLHQVPVPASSRSLAQRARWEWEWAIRQVPCSHIVLVRPTLVSAGSVVVTRPQALKVSFWKPTWRIWNWSLPYERLSSTLTLSAKGSMSVSV